eukprot:c20467_g1_i1.p2 GENE.c20467_g1_i1~~c20467_g1_i1.p2  ORF type:complete len:109 (-),score=5.39 c20467_g1_i1:362-688(-)
MLCLFNKRQRKAWTGEKRGDSRRTRVYIWHTSFIRTAHKTQNDIFRHCTCGDIASHQRNQDHAVQFAAAESQNFLRMASTQQRLLPEGGKNNFKNKRLHKEAIESMML